MCGPSVGLDHNEPDAACSTTFGGAYALHGAAVVIRLLGLIDVIAALMVLQ